MSPRIDITVSPMTADDLVRGAEIYLDAFEHDNIMTILRPAWLCNANYTREKRNRLMAYSFKKAYLESDSKICMKAAEMTPQGEKIHGMAIWAKPGAPIRVPTKEELEVFGDEGPDEETDTGAVLRLARELARSRTELHGSTPHWYVTYYNFCDPHY